MPRYIDADALSNFANNQVGGITANHIMRFPTADVEPVRHGQWYEYGEQSYKRCSICHERYSAPLGVFPPFCLNCGAKMDGGENK